MAGAAGPPPDGGTERGHQYGDQKGPGHPVGELRESGLLQRGAFHQRNDLGESGGGAHLLNPDFNHRAQVVAAGRYGCTERLVHGPRLSGQQRFIGLGAAAADRSIGGKRLSRPHANDVAHAQAAGGDARKLPRDRVAPLDTVGQPIGDGLQRSGGAVSQAQLEQTAREQKEHKHGERVVIDLDTKRPGGIERAQRADGKRDQHSERNGHVHAHPALADISQRAREKRPARKQHHRHTDHPRGPAQQLFHLGRQIAGHGLVRGPCVHHHLHHAKAGDQPTPQCAPAFALALLAHQRVHCGQAAIPGAADRGHPLRRQHLRGIPHHPGASRGGTDRHLHHAGDLLQRIFDRQRTGRAMHAVEHHKGLPRDIERVSVHWNGGLWSAKSGPLFRIIQ